MEFKDDRFCSLISIFKTEWKLCALQLRTSPFPSHDCETSPFPSHDCETSPFPSRDCETSSFPSHDCETSPFPSRDCETSPFPCDRVTGIFHESALNRESLAIASALSPLSLKHTAVHKFCLGFN
jgi:hypothetical protein